MKKSLLPKLLIATSLLLLSTTNCANPADSASTSASVVTPLACSGTSCMLPNEARLAIESVPSNGRFVAPSYMSIDIGGECNEGGYPSNVIAWDLKLGSTTVRSSSQFGRVDRCTNGRYQIFVDLTYQAFDPCNRTGLWSCSSGLKGQYDLYVSVVATDQGGKTHKSPAKLVPLN